MKAVGTCIFTYYKDGFEFEHNTLSEIIENTLFSEDNTFQQINAQENSKTKVYEIPINTKYYSTKIHLWFFNDFINLLDWIKQDSGLDQNVLALVVQVEISDANQNFCTKLKEIIHHLKATTGVFRKKFFLIKINI